MNFSEPIMGKEPKKNHLNGSDPDNRAEVGIFITFLNDVSKGVF